MLVVPADAAATAANILGNELLFRLELALSVLAVAFNLVRMALGYVLFRPVGRIVTLISAFIGLVAVALQASSILFELPVLTVLKSEAGFAGFSAEQLQSLALIFLRWNAQASNLYLAFFGFWCMVGGYIIYKSTFLPRILGVLLAIAGWATPPTCGRRSRTPCTPGTWPWASASWCWVSGSSCSA